MNFESHLQYQDDVSNIPGESVTYGESSPYSITYGESVDYCELKPVDLSLSRVMSPNIDTGVYSSSSNMNMEYLDISYSDYRDPYSRSPSESSYEHSRSPWNSDSTHSPGADGGFDPNSQDYSRSQWGSDGTQLYQAEGGSDPYSQEYNISRSSSEYSDRSCGYDISPNGESGVTLDELDEVLNLEGMIISPAICEPNENRPDFSKSAYTQRAKVVGTGHAATSNEDSTISSYAEKYMQIKEQNAKRAKKYRLQKQQNIKEVQNTIPQLEERNQDLKSEYDSLKKNIDSLKQLLPKLQK